MPPNEYSVWLEIVKTTGIVAIALINIWTLRVAQATHQVANSRLSETIAKVDILTAALATSEQQRREQA